MRILKYKSENFEKEASSNMPGREEQAALIEMKPSKRVVEAIASTRVACSPSGFDLKELKTGTPFKPRTVCTPGAEMTELGLLEKSPRKARRRGQEKARKGKKRLIAVRMCAQRSGHPGRAALPFTVPAKSKSAFMGPGSRRVM